MTDSCANRPPLGLHTPGTSSPQSCPQVTLSLLLVSNAMGLIIQEINVCSFQPPQHPKPSLIRRVQAPPSPKDLKLRSLTAGLIGAPATRAPPFASTLIPARSAELTLMLPSTAWGNPRTTKQRRVGKSYTRQCSLLHL